MYGLGAASGSRSGEESRGEESRHPDGGLKGVLFEKIAADCDSPGKKGPFVGFLSSEGLLESVRHSEIEDCVAVTEAVKER